MCRVKNVVLIFGLLSEIRYIGCIILKITFNLKVSITYIYFGYAWVNSTNSNVQNFKDINNLYEIFFLILKKEAFL